VCSEVVDETESEDEVNEEEGEVGDDADDDEFWWAEGARSLADGSRPLESAYWMICRSRVRFRRDDVDVDVDSSVVGLVISPVDPLVSSLSLISSPSSDRTYLSLLEGHHSFAK
jgi:hypothetical protein